MTNMNSQPTSDAMSDNVRGSVVMGASMLAFVANDALMKYLFTDMSIYQAVFLRGALTVPVIAMIAQYRQHLFVRIAPRDWKFVFMRVICEVLGTVFFLTALAHMPLANVTAILQAVPLMVTMAAALFLAEAVGWRRWMAIIIGFSGVLVIIRPGMEGFSIYSLSAVAAVVCITVRDITTRKLSTTVPSLLVALLTAIAIMILGLVMLPTIEWAPVTNSHWIILSGTAIAIICGYLFSVMAMRVGEISFVAPFRYTAMVWAITLGILLFGEWPDTLTMIGTGIIVATGLYSFHREKKLRNLQKS